MSMAAIMHTLFFKMIRKLFQQQFKPHIWRPFQSWRDL